MAPVMSLVLTSGQPVFTAAWRPGTCPSLGPCFDHSVLTAFDRCLTARFDTRAYGPRYGVLDPSRAFPSPGSAAAAAAGSGGGGGGWAGEELAGGGGAAAAAAAGEKRDPRDFALWKPAAPGETGCAFDRRRF